MKYFIIADDFTGACEIGSEFKKKGYSVTLFPIIPLNNNEDCVVFSTSTRKEFNEKKKKYLNNILDEFLLNYKINNNIVLYKKIDSTLRGNIVEELNVILSKLNFEVIFFIPNYPELGKCSKNGKYTVNDILIEKTEYSKEIKYKFNSTLIELTSKLNINSVHFNNIDIKEIYNKILNIKKKPVILSFDIYKQEHLKKINIIIEKIKKECKVLICGSVSIIKEFQKKHYFNKINKDEFSLENRKMLFINGSYNSVSILQFKHLKKISGLIQLKINDNENSKNNSNKQIEFFDKQYCSIETFLPYNKNLERRIEDLLILKTLDVFEKMKPHIIIISGGQTALNIVKILKFKCLKIIDEIENGVVVISAKLKKKKFFLIIKPGGYGNKDLLKKCINYFS